MSSKTDEGENGVFVSSFEVDPIALLSSTVATSGKIFSSVCGNNLQTNKACSQLVKIIDEKWSIYLKNLLSKNCFGSLTSVLFESSLTSEKIFAL